MRKLSRSSTAASATSTNGAPPPPSPSPSVAIPASLLDPALPLPRLFVFDLDYTLWPFWVDTHPTPPLKPASSPPRAAATAAVDRHGEEFAFYPDVPQILHFLPRAPSGGPVRLAVASRTSATALARDLLKILHVPAAADGGQAAGDKPRRAGDVFDAGLEIYPGSKVRHFEALQRRTGVAYEDMLFFDDESRNLETERLGVTMRLIRDGLSWGEVEKGVEEWRKRRGYKKN